MTPDVSQDHEFGESNTESIADDKPVEPQRPHFTLESIMGSVPSLPNQSEDFEREIEEAMEERADELVRRLREG